MRAALIALPPIACLGLALASAAPLPVDTGDTGPDTGDTGPDTGDTGPDTGDTSAPPADSAPHVGAADLAGEGGGCAGCAIPGHPASGLVPVLAALLLARRRRGSA